MSSFVSLSPGSVLEGRYQIQELIGSGKSSSIFTATDLKHNLQVAIKVLDPFLAQDPINVERFKREVQILREMDHPGIIRVFDIVTEGPTIFIVMEYFASSDGGKHLKQIGRYSLESFLSVAKTITEIVKACHARKVIHRDLKPQNILFSATGNIKLVDFGISKMTSMSDLTKTGTSLGTPDYMPPEAFTDSSTDARGDIYALGTIFYQMLSGFSPFESLSLGQLMREKMQPKMRPLNELRQDIPEWLSDIVSRCMCVEPVNRYQSCADLLADLDRQEKALAMRLKLQEGGSCIHCKSPMIAGLAFCHSCGKFRSDAFIAGDHSIVLYKIENTKRLSDYLSKNFAGALEIASEAKLKKVPILLLKGCNKESATALVNELYSVTATASVVKNLPREFLLPPIYFFIAVCGLIPSFLLNDVSMRILAVALTEAAIFGLFRWRTVAVIRSPQKRSTKASDPLIVHMATTMKSLSDNRLQAILGRIALSFQNISNHSALPPEIANRLHASLQKCISFSESIQSHVRYLHERSVPEIRRKLDALNHRIESEQEPSVLEGLIQQKSSLMAEYKNYRTIQDTYSDSTSSLLGFLEKLQTIERSLEAGAPVGQLDLESPFGTEKLMLEGKAA